MESGKRKRDDSHERKVPLTNQRRTKLRQEHMEEEFAATYHGVTALYKLLEVEHLQSPLFLPRTLSYRVDPNWQQDGKSAAKSDPKKERKTVTPAAGGKMDEIKISMAAHTMEAFKKSQQKAGLMLSLFTANDKKFEDNQFKLVASCLIPVPCSKKVVLPKQFLHLEADICVLAFQVVKINDDSLAQKTSFSFAAPSTTETLTTVSGKDLLTKCSNGFEPLFGNILRLNMKKRRTGFFEIELPAVASSVQGGVKCEFRVTWEPIPKTKKMQRLASICESKLKVDTVEVKSDDTFRLAIPKRDIVANPTHNPCGGVWFHFLYHSMLRRMSEKRTDYSCAWCNMYAGSLRGLVAHLVSSHDRFRFQATVGHDNIPHIYVMVMQEHQPRKPSSGRLSAFSELDLYPCEEPDRFKNHFTHLSGKKYGSQGSYAAEAIDGLMQEFDEMDELSNQEHSKEFYAPLLQRQYFHSRTGAVVLDHEKDYDSDDDVDETWITKQSERLLDEFEDVSLEEKEFMKKWNRHVKEFKILADFMVASSCRMFARKHGQWLLDHGLRHNFLLHLLNLWDNSLLNSRAIIDCMLIVDQNQNSDTTKGEAAPSPAQTSVDAQ